MPQELPEGDPVEVGEHDGVITHDLEADTLAYVDGGGHFVQIQAWKDPLGWTDEQLIRFAEGVQATSNAEALESAERRSGTVGALDAVHAVRRGSVQAVIDTWASSGHPVTDEFGAPVPSYPVMR